MARKEADPAAPENIEETNPRDVGFEEAPAPQGLKKPPPSDPGEESGEWTRGGGSDPKERGASRTPGSND